MQNFRFRPQGIINQKSETQRGIMQSSERWPNTRSVLLLAMFFGFFVLGSFISPATANARSLKAVARTAKQMKRREKAMRLTLAKAYGKLPIRFEINRGQTSPAVNFLSRGQGYTLFLTGGEVVLSLQSASKHSNPEGQPLASLLTGSLFSDASGFAPLSLFSGIMQSNSQIGSEIGRAPRHSVASSTSQNRAVLHLRLVGASPHARAAGLDELPGTSNYFIGNDPQRWLTNIPNYAKVRYHDIYPGVDLVYYGNPDKAGQLEYDFVIAPGADPGSIKLSIEGADHLSLGARGNLLIAVAGGQVFLHKPIVYQEASAETSSTKRIPSEKHYLSGQYELAANGQVSFKVGAYDVSKPLVIDPVLTYSTYLGGTNFDIGTRIAVDSSGDAYVTGLTSSTNFPNTAGAIGQPIGSQTCGMKLSRQTFPCPDVFVTKLSPDGKTILYSTILGGSRADGATGISVDGNGNVFLTGFTSSSDFPTTSGVVQVARTGQSDVFVSKLNSTGSALLYSTFLGGSKDDIPTGIATDSTGSVYIAGVTFSGDFPTTAGSFQSAIAGGTCSGSVSGYTTTCPDAFVAKLNSTGTALVYATYLGGSSYDGAASIGVDSTGSAYVTGITDSTNFPTTANAYQSTNSGGSCGPSRATHPCTQAFVAKLSPTGQALTYSTYFGGNGDTMGTAITVDGSGNAYVAGITNSTNLPTTGQSYAVGTCGSTTNSFNCPDAFVAKFNSGGSALSYLTYLGGTSYDFATDIRLDGAGDAYVVGGTDSLDFPVSSSAVQLNFGGGSCNTTVNTVTYNFDCPNAFLTVLNTTGSALYSTFLGGAGGEVALGVAVDTSGNAYLSGTTISADFPVANAEQAQLAGDSDAFVAKMSGLSTSTAPVVLAPNALNFGSVMVGSASTSQTLTLSNSGSNAVSITSITVAGANSGDFSQTNTCGSSVAASSSCTISVAFAPSASGPRSGTLSVADSASNSPQTASLSGQGEDFSLTASTNSQTVTAGGTASYDLTLTPEGGFNQAVNLSCSGAPAHSTCSVQPASVTLDGTNNGSAKLTVSTTAASIAGPGDPGDFTPPSGSLPLAVWLALFSLSEVIAVIRISRKGSVFRRLAPFAALALLVVFWAACGGGSSPAPSTSNGTPAGTYTLTVTGTSGSLQHSTTITLVVN
jgi:hypothetical protein